MSDAYILFLAVLVFTLLLIGIVLTAVEFKKLEEESLKNENDDAKN
ncbi:MAG: hypothetical protein KJO81_12030 [Gammaproteobacteria bacterium]|nr:hypothetical protein [Gammaproteobacteria bacterium]